jgi:nucleoside-diphosphate-sugar epimerase
MSAQLPWTGRKVLVTGATGCVGRHALPLLVERGWDVHAVASKQDAPDVNGVTWHRANLLNRTAMEAVVRDADATHLLHLAWFVAPGKWAAAPENFDWVTASLALVRAFRQAGGTRVVTAGSCLEYDWSYGYCSETRTPCTPQTIYGTCKHALQLMTTALASDEATTSAWARVFFLYGPHEHPDRLVASVIRSLLAGEPARTSHGNQVRDYLYAGDVADAFVSLLESPVTGPINIASGRPIRLLDIVTRIGQLMGRPDLIRLGAIPAAPTDTPLVVADTTRLTSALGWQPRTDLDEGLRQTIAWWQTTIAASAKVPS